MVTATGMKYWLRLILLVMLVSVASEGQVSAEDMVVLTDASHHFQLNRSPGCVREREKEREGVLCGNETCLLFQLQAFLFRGSNPGLDDLQCYPLMTASASTRRLSANHTPVKKRTGLIYVAG